VKALGDCVLGAVFAEQITVKHFVAQIGSVAQIV
jgi:hypothetical protein